MFSPTTIQPHTMTAGPPVVCSPSEKRITSNPLRDAHQTEEKQGGDTSDDADDGERDTKVLLDARSATTQA